MESTAAYDLRLDALQMLDGDEAYLSASLCKITCALTCQDTCFITG